MFCQSCGMALSQQMRYCNRCGTQLSVPSEESPAKGAREKRLDNYLDGLFWITVLGLAFVFGGTLLIKRFNAPDWFVFGYIVFSSVAFLINFALNLWGVARIYREIKADRWVGPSTITSELAAPPEVPALTPPTPLSSVTDNTTRSFDPVYAKRKAD